MDATRVYWTSITSTGGNTALDPRRRRCAGRRALLSSPGRRRPEEDDVTADWTPCRCRRATVPSRSWARRSPSSRTRSRSWAAAWHRGFLLLPSGGAAGGFHEAAHLAFGKSHRIDAFARCFPPRFESVAVNPGLRIWVWGLRPNTESKKSINSSISAGRGGVFAVAQMQP